VGEPEVIAPTGIMVALVQLVVSRAVGETRVTVLDASGEEKARTNTLPNGERRSGEGDRSAAANKDRTETDAG
jgi:hypothetical protein